MQAPTGPLCASSLNLDWLESDLSSELSLTHIESRLLPVLIKLWPRHWPLGTKHSQTGIKHSWRTGETTWGCPLCRKKKKKKSPELWNCMRKSFKASCSAQTGQMFKSLQLEESKVSYYNNISAPLPNVCQHKIKCCYHDCHLQNPFSTDLPFSNAHLIWFLSMFYSVICLCSFIILLCSMWIFALNQYTQLVNGYETL